MNSSNNRKNGNKWKRNTQLFKSITKNKFKIKSKKLKI